MKVWLSDSSEHLWCFMHRLRSSFPLSANVHQHKESVKGRKGEKLREGSEAGGEVQSIRFMSVRRRWICTVLS